MTRLSVSVGSDFPSVTAGNEGEAAGAAGRRPGRLSRFDQDPEVAAFVQERLGRMPVVGIAEAALARFGPERAPRKTAISRYWHRLDGERRTG